MQCIAGAWLQFKDWRSSETHAVNQAAYFADSVGQSGSKGIFQL